MRMEFISCKIEACCPTYYRFYSIYNDARMMPIPHPIRKNLTCRCLMLCWSYICLRAKKSVSTKYPITNPLITRYPGISTWLNNTAFSIPNHVVPLIAIIPITMVRAKNIPFSISKRIDILSVKS